MPIRFPSDQQRLSIIGATGSGKTQAALWHLSHRHFDTMPWLVYNFKSDESIESIPYLREVDVDELPSQPGIYVTRPLPGQTSEVESQMWEIWQRGHIGVYIDEGYMVGGKNEAFRALLTQGRSKHIPMIINSQRPVWMDRFVFSESEFFQVFRLQHSDDRKSVGKFVPAPMDKRLPEFHSYYYDVGQDRVVTMMPVPSIETIHSTFARRLSVLEATKKKVV